jgi:RND family efflux transporter MFP subunit
VDDGHSHDPSQPGGHTHDEPGVQLADGSRGVPAGVGSAPTVSLTGWTLLSELFVEFPALEVGETSRFAIHVTDLTDFSPLASGEVVVVLRDHHGERSEFRGGLSRPGVFGVDVTPPARDTYRLSVRIVSEPVNDLHLLGSATAYAEGELIPLPAAPPTEIVAYLKEQQWNLEFATEEVEERLLASSLVIPATVEPRSGGDAVLAAPVAGRVELGSTVPVPGMRVRAGEVMARITPRSTGLRDAAGLRADLVDAESQYELARQERRRAERLVEARALPARRLSEAEAREASSRARLDAARQRIQGLDSVSRGEGEPGGAWLALRAPFDGVVAKVHFAAGSSVQEGDVLLRLVDPDQVHVVGAVPESRVATLKDIDEAELLVNGEAPLPLGSAAAVGGVLDPATRTVEVRYELDNREHRLPVGRGVHLRLLLGQAEERPAVPESAVVDDGGRLVVFVQQGGELFQRRPVQLGSSAGGYVHVLRGVENGERVVSSGAYLIRLAALSTQIPAHGHVH